MKSEHPKQNELFDAILRDDVNAMRKFDTLNMSLEFKFGERKENVRPIFAVAYSNALNCYIYLSQIVYKGNVNMKLNESSRLTPLHYALFGGSFEIVQYIISQLLAENGEKAITELFELECSCKDINDSLLFRAAKNPNIDIFEYLQSVGFNLSDFYKKNQKIFKEISKELIHKNSVECLTLFLKNVQGVSSDKSPIKDAIVWLEDQEDGLQALKSLVPYYNVLDEIEDNKDAFWYACYHSRIQIIDFFIDYFEAINRTPPKSLFIGLCKVGDYALIQKAVEKFGEKINYTAVLNHSDKTENAFTNLSGLDKVAPPTICQILDLVFANGVDINVRIEGKTILSIFLEHFSLNPIVIRYLIDKGSDLEQKVPIYGRQETIKNILRSKSTTNFQFKKLISDVLNK